MAPWIIPFLNAIIRGDRTREGEGEGEGERERERWRKRKRKRGIKKYITLVFLRLLLIILSY